MIRTTLLMAGAAAVASLAAPRPTAQASYAPVPPGGAAAGTRVARDADGLFRVDGRRGDAQVAFVVDTGATATVLSARDAARLGVAGAGAVARMTTAGGQARMRWGRLDGLIVAGRTLPVLEVVVAEAGLGEAGLAHSLLGQDAIAALGRLTIERDRMEIGARR